MDERTDGRIPCKSRDSHNVGSYLSPPPLHERSLSGIMIWHLRACGGSLRPRFSRFNRRESAGLRSAGRRGAHGGDPGGTETYPFCSSTSLRPATCQTVPSHSPFSEYKQRAGYTELEPSIMSLLIYHSSSAAIYGVSRST